MKEYASHLLTVNGSCIKCLVNNDDVNSLKVKVITGEQTTSQTRLEFVSNSYVLFNLDDLSNLLFIQTRNKETYKNGSFFKAEMIGKYNQLYAVSEWKRKIVAFCTSLISKHKTSTVQGIEFTLNNVCSLFSNQYQINSINNAINDVKSRIVNLKAKSNSRYLTDDLLKLLSLLSEHISIEPYFTKAFNCISNAVSNDLFFEWIVDTVQELQNEFDCICIAPNKFVSAERYLTNHSDVYRTSLTTLENAFRLVVNGQDTGGSSNLLQAS